MSGHFEHEFVVARGYLQVRRWWVVDSRAADAVRRSCRRRIGGVTDDEVERGGRGDGGQSRRSRFKEQKLYLSLPWEKLGPYPALVTLTYPGGDWRPWVSDGRVCEAHRINFAKRWRRAWPESPLIGTWKKEFQRRGAPHLHVFVGLPEAMAVDDYKGLQERTQLGLRLERQYGKRVGRSKVPIIGGDYGGMFGYWLRQQWSEVVGTAGVDRNHHARGVDVRVWYWGRGELVAERMKVAEYLIGDVGKAAQKHPPEGFVGVGNYYGVFGRKLGFEPVEQAVPVSEAVYAALERRLARAARLRIRKRGGKGTNFERRRVGDGATAFGVGSEDAGRVYRWAVQSVERAVARSERSVAARSA